CARVGDYEDDTTAMDYW
nr:immunoglobulin heavy chain junction region [Macaca mulatta]